MKDFHVWNHLKKFDLHIRLLLFPFLLLGVLLLAGLILLRLQLSIAATQLQPVSIPEIFTPYPNMESVPTATISATTAIVMDANSHIILYEKNPFIQSSMASTTKMMTALVGLDYYKPTDVLEVQRNEVEGSGLHLFSGEKFHFEDLLYAVFLPSANDAAMAIADNYPGGENAFVAAMNKKAKELHLLHTFYQDPAGLQDTGDYTTVTDLANLAAIVLQNPLLHKIVSTKYAYITTINQANAYQLTNLNELLGYDGIIGIKTGTTEGAGQVLVTAKQDGDHTYIIVVMDSIDRYADTMALLPFIDNNVRYTTVQEMEQQLK